MTAGSDWGTSFYWCGPLASELRTELLHFQCVLRRELLPSEWSPGVGKESLTSWHAHLEFILDNADLGWEFWQYQSSREKLEPLPGIWGDSKLHFLGHAHLKKNSLHAELGRRNRWWSRDHTSLLCSPGFIWYIGHVIIHLCRTLSWNNNKKY